MQNQHLKLKEIIWEITQTCHNNCEYCGSKETRNNPTNEEIIFKIAQEIVDYPPESVNISGGDPICVSLETHKQIVKMFKDQKITTKIIVNPLSVKQPNFYEICCLYDWIGISVNTSQELKAFEDVYSKLYGTRITVISNFNCANVFLFEKIASKVKDRKLLWQIQYTMYPIDQTQLPLYKNPDAGTFFFQKIQEAAESGIKIILADNLNNGKCGAGLSSCGILANGDVIPCLSMRAWCSNNEIHDLVQGNLCQQSLGYIWESDFHSQRFQDFRCCKDHCQNKFCEFMVKEQPKTIFEEFLKICPISPKENDKKQPRIMVYGVGQEPNVYLYGVATAPTVMMYGVGTDSTGE